MRRDQIEALVARAAHPATPIEEARSCGVILAKAIADGRAELHETGTNTKLQAAELLLALARSEAEARAHASSSQPRSERRWVEHDEPQAAPAPAKPRAIRAKYAGRCLHCREPYSEGEQVFWAQGRGCAHLACVAARDSRAA